MPRQSPSTYTPEDDARLIAMRSQGLYWTEIAEALGRSFNSVKGRHSQLTKTGERSNGVSINPLDFGKQCERHAQAVMRHGGFAAFTDNGDKRGAFGICAPLVWPKKIAISAKRS